MIGRDAELEHLQKALYAAMEEQTPHFVTVVGEAGVGKSRLLYEFGNGLDLMPETVLYFRGRADQQTSNLPYFIIHDLLASRFEIKHSDRAAVAREKLEQGAVDLVGAASPDARVWAHFIGHLIGLDFSDSPYLRGILNDARQIHDRAFHYFVQFLAAITAPSASLAPAGETAGNPVVLFLEDLHWADDGSLDLIEHLALECRAPLLIVALTRPDLFERRPAWGEGSAHHTRLELRPLSQQDSRHLVEEILRQVDQLPPDLRDMIADRAEGNPFYIEELVKMLIEDGVIVKGAERWQVEPRQLAGVRVPATLVGVLQARLDGLPLPERKALQCASVVGQAFWDGAVESIIELANGWASTREGRAVLQRMCERELIFKRKPSAFIEEEEYTFKHPILHDVTYESVLKQQRRAYHARVATWLIERSGERVAEYAGLIGEHYELAGDRINAAEWYGRAGKQAQDAYAPQAAIDYYQKALAFLPTETGEGSDPHTAQRVELYRGLGSTLRQQTRFEEATQAFKAMRTAAEANGDLVAQAEAWVGLSQVQHAQGDYRAALESATQAEVISRAASAPAQETLANVLCHKGWILSDLEEAEAALTLGEQALALSTPLDARRVMAHSLNLLGWVHKTLEHYEQATRHFEQALALYQELGDRVWVGGTLNNLGTTASSRGDYRAAAALLQDALSTARESGHRYAEIVVLNNLGEARIGLGEYQAAEADLRQAIEVAEAVSWGGLAETYRSLAQAYLGQGKLTEALAAARRALELGQESGLQEDIGGAWRALGMVLAYSEVGRPKGGKSEVGTGALRAPGEQVEPSPEECFAKSLQIFAEMGMESERARTLRAWASYEIEKGDRARGLRMGQDAQEIFARLGMRKVTSDG